MRTALVACLALVALTGVARAGEPRRVVLVVSAGAEEARAKSTLDAIRAQLGDLPVGLVVTPAESAPKDLRERLDFAAKACKENGAVGAFFVELERADDLLLYLIEPEAKRALVRRVRKTAGAEQAGAEELSLIVRSTVGALLEGREIGMEVGPELRPPPARKPPEPVPTLEKPKKPSPARAPKSTDTARLAAHYAGEAFAPEAQWQSGLGIELSGSPDALFYFGLGYVALAPVEVETESARVRVARYPLRAFVGYEVPADRFRFVGQLGVVSELDRRSTTKTAGGVTPTDSGDRLVWAASPRVLMRYKVWERTSVGVGVGLDVFFNNSKYVVQLPGRQETLLSPYRARAEALAGLAVDIW